MSRARRVPVRRVTHGDSRSFTEQLTMLLTCAAAGPAGAATSFASRCSTAAKTVAHRERRRGLPALSGSWSGTTPGLRQLARGQGAFGGREWPSC